MKYVPAKILLTLCINFLCLPLKAQSLGDFFKLRGPVKIWVITHPFSACKAARLSTEAQEMTQKVKTDSRLDKYENGGRLDAFRHAYWMALLSQEFNCRRAYRLGLAHEKGNKIDFRKDKTEEGAPVDSISISMDLYNNCIGVHLGFENPEASHEEIAEIVMREIAAGKMKIIKRDEAGNLLSCEGKIIEKEEWEGIWNNERCLVNSDN